MSSNVLSYTRTIKCAAISPSASAQLLQLLLFRFYLQFKMKMNEEFMLVTKFQGPINSLDGAILDVIRSKCFALSLLV